MLVSQGEKAASSPLLISQQRARDGDSPGGGRAAVPELPPEAHRLPVPASLSWLAKTLFLLFPPLSLLFLSPSKL